MTDITEGISDLKVIDEDSAMYRCRFYENQYPEPDELVMANVTKIGDMGAYVKLLEYNDIEGMILLSELSRRRIRSINKLVRVNRVEVVLVMRVDKEKGYIDLSKRRVDADGIVKCEERFNKAKAVHSVLRYIAEQSHIPLESLYQTVGWPLYRKFGHAYDAFKLAISGSDDIFEGLEVDEKIKESILSYIKKRLAQQPTKVRADIEVTCFTYDGIDAIKHSLNEGENHSTPDIPIKIRLIAPPSYVLTTYTQDKDLGIERMNQAIEIIKATILSHGGSMDIKMAPKAITHREESEFQAMLDRLASDLEEEDAEEDEA